MLVYLIVDDLLVTCVFKEGLEKLYEVLIKKHEKVKVTRGERHPYLGMIENFQQPGVVVIGNPGFMSDLMKRLFRPHQPVGAGA